MPINIMLNYIVGREIPGPPGPPLITGLHHHHHHYDYYYYYY